MKDASKIMNSLVNQYGMTIQQVADAISVSEQSTRHWYTGARKPKLSLLIRLQQFHTRVFREGRDAALVSDRTRYGREAGALVDLINERPIRERIAVIILVLSELNAEGKV